MTQAVEITKLPTSITRPLRISAAGLFGFLGVLILWAVFAQIATTIRVNGNFASSKPSYEIQHPFGGRLEQVFVALHQIVAKGDPLFMLDVNTQKKSLAQTAGQLEVYLAENRIIQQYLKMTAPEVRAQGYIDLQYHQARVTLETKVNTHLDRADSALERLQTVRNGIVLLEQRQEIYRKRAQSRQDLVSRGILARREEETLEDTILSLGSELEQQRSLVISLQSEAEQSELAVATLKSEYRGGLVRKLNSNRQKLPELHRQISSLEAEISAALVRSPAAGKVISLKFDTEQMYAGKGQTLATLAQTLDHPVVHMKVPVASIDQVYNGMTGTLTIPALPQRQMPKIRLTITSLAPEAQKNADGQPEHYLALATINPEDLKLAARQMGTRFRLSTDMPISVALEGRTTTMYEYLFGAFANLFTGALQD